MIGCASVCKKSQRHTNKPEFPGLNGARIVAHDVALVNQVFLQVRKQAQPNQNNALFVLASCFLLLAHAQSILMPQRHMDTLTHLCTLDVDPLLQGLDLLG